MSPVASHVAVAVISCPWETFLLVWKAMVLPVPGVVPTMVLPEVENAMPFEELPRGVAPSLSVLMRLFTTLEAEAKVSSTPSRSLPEMRFRASGALPSSCLPDARRSGYVLRPRCGLPGTPSRAVLDMRAAQPPIRPCATRCRMPRSMATFLSPTSPHHEHEEK